MLQIVKLLDLSYLKNFFLKILITFVVFNRFLRLISHFIANKMYLHFFIFKKWVAKQKS